MKNLQEQKSEKIETARERILREANEEARNILQDAKDYADKTIKNYNKWSKDSGLNKDMEHERNALRDKLNSTESKLTFKSNTKTTIDLKAHDSKLGDGLTV